MQRENEKGRSLLPRHLPPIMINVVDKQRYNTAGDYYATTSGWQFAVSKQKSVDDEFLILIHELVEWYLTQRNGIREEDITAFDVANPSSRDPGSEPNAPYRNEHRAAMEVEQLIIDHLNKIQSLGSSRRNNGPPK